MKKIGFLLLFTCFFLASYNLFLYAYPLKKTVFYTNVERVEEYVYSNKKYTSVIVGSSLSGAFEGKEVFGKNHFNFYLHFTGAGTGIDAIRRSEKIPEKLFIEINYIKRPVNKVLLNYVFDEPIYNLRHYLPFLQTKNKLLPNLMDRVKAPANNTVNKKRPPEKLYNELIEIAKSEWSSIDDTILLKKHLDSIKQGIVELAARGVTIYFYEIPMDSSLNNSALIVFQRAYFTKLASDMGYKFIENDNSRDYNTGDGLHLLKEDADIYAEYFKSKLQEKPF